MQALEIRAFSSVTATGASVRPVRVLIVDNRSDDATSLARGLARYGHETVTVDNGATAIQTHLDAELVLLDLELPDIDGLEVCRRIRATSDTPIIAFCDGKLDRVLGLQAGADDCLDKPYEFRELTARIDAVMRRSRPRGAVCVNAASIMPRNGSRAPSVEVPAQHTPEDARADGPGEGRAGTLSIGSLTIDTAFRQVRVCGKPIELTRKEFDLLHYLATNSDTVITRRRLMADVWGDQSPHAASAQASRTIDTHVSSLRGKLGEGSWIRTVRGVGFRFDDPDEKHQN